MMPSVTLYTSPQGRELLYADTIYTASSALGNGDDDAIPKAASLVHGPL